MVLLVTVLIGVLELRGQSVYEPYAFTTLAGSPQVSGTDDNTGSLARFNQPWGLALDGDGNIYVADALNHAIRKITPGGVTTTIAGAPGTPGFSDGPVGAALFSRPTGVAVSFDGAVIYVADYNNQVIRRISGGTVSTLAGTVGVTGVSDGTGPSAQFHNPFGVALNADRTVLYVTDQNNESIRAISLPSGVVTTFAGASGISGSTDDPANNLNARFNTPRGIAVDAADNVYVADSGNLIVRKIFASGGVTTLAGAVFTPGFDDGPGASARFSILQVISPFGGPCGLAADSSGSVFVTDQGNHTIRKIGPDGTVTTLGGTPQVSGAADGIAAAARFNYPAGIAVDAAGVLYLADTLNHTIRVGTEVPPPECPEEPPLDAEGNLILPEGLDPSLVTYVEVNHLIGSPEEQYPNFDTSIDLWYAGLDCDQSIGGTVPVEASNPDIEGALAEIGITGVTPEEIAAAILEWEQQITDVVMSQTNSLPTAGAVGPDYYPPAVPYCPDPNGKYAFGGRDIIFVHGLQLGHLIDKIAGNPHASETWVTPTSFPGSTENPEFYEGGYFKGKAEEIWEEKGHIAKFLADHGYMNRYLIVDYPCTQRLEVGAQAILTQISDAMHFGTGVTSVAHFLDPSVPVDTSNFGTPSFVVVSHSTGTILTDVAMTAAAQNPNLNAAYIPQMCKAHVAMDGVFSGSALATAGIAISGLISDPGVAWACTLAKESMAGLDPTVNVPECSAFAVFADSVLVDLVPLVAQTKWGPSIEAMPVRTLTLVGGHPTWLQPLKYVLMPGYDDGVTTINSQVANPNSRLFWPSGFRPDGSGFIKPFDMGLAGTGNGQQSGLMSPKRALGYYIDQVVEPGRVPPLLIAGGATPYISPSGMRQDYADELANTQFSTLNRYHNHFSFIQSASDHLTGYTGTAGGFNGADYFATEFIQANREETRVITDEAVYESFPMVYSWDNAPLLSRDCVPKVETWERGRYIPAIEFTVFGQDFKWGPWWIWRRLYDLLEGWETKMGCDYMYESVLACPELPGCPTCIDAPSDLALWLPLDETDGSIAYNLADETIGTLYDGAAVAASSSGPSPLVDDPTHSTPFGSFNQGSRWFDGIDDSVQVPDYAAGNVGTGDFTLGAWIMLDSDGDYSSTRVLLDKRNPSTGTGYIFVLSSGRLLLLISDGSGSFGLVTLHDSANVPADGLWHFVGVTVDRDSVNGAQFYLDGNPTGTYDPSGHPLSLDNTGPFVVGGSLLGGSQNWLGGIDELVLFTRALTVLEMRSIYAASSLGLCKDCCLYPLLLTAATDKTVECGETWDFDQPSVRDLCDGDPEIVEVGTVNSGACPATLTRTWQATNSCGRTAICSQIVTITDTTPPVFDGAPDKTVEAGSAWTFDEPTATDNCGSVTITVLGTVVSGICPEVITRTWQAADHCGNTTTYSQSVTVLDTTPPALTCVADKTVECGSAWTFDAPTATDNGGDVTIAVLSTVSVEGCPEVITRIWQATDACGNTATCRQTVTVTDTTPPVLTCAPDKTVECGAAWSFDEPSATDACDGADVIVSILDTIDSGSGCSLVSTRTWEASDACGNSTTCSQTVSVLESCPNLVVNGSFETTDPVLATDESRNTFDPLTGVPGWTTVSGGFLEVWRNDAGFPASDGLNQLEINAQSDDETVTQVVSGLRTDCPVMFCFDYTGRFGDEGGTPNNDFTVTLTSKEVDFTTTLNPVSHGTDGWLRFCTEFTPSGSTVTIEFRGKPHYSDGTIYTEGGAHIDNVSLIQCCEEESPGIELSCSADKTVECGTDWTFDEPVALNACALGPVTVTVLSTESNEQCPEVITRTWEVSDACGHSATCSQTVTVMGTAPLTLGCGAAQEVFSAGTDDDFAGPEPTSPSAGLLLRLQAGGAASFKGFDDCTIDNFVAHTFTGLPSCITEATLRIRLRGCGSTLNNNDSIGLGFTSEDVKLGASWGRYLGSGNPATGILNQAWGSGSTADVLLDLSQLPNPDGSSSSLLDALNSEGFLDFTVQDDTSVDLLVLTVKTCCTSDKTVECGEDWSFDEPIPAGGCGEVTVTVLSTETSGDCPTVSTRTWEATDACGETAIFSQTVTVEDTTPPELTCAPDKVIECGADWSFDEPTATDACGGDAVTVTVLGTVSSRTCPDLITRTWEATDACGNTATCSQTVTVQSAEPPHFVNLPPNGHWTETGSMNVARSTCQSVLLPDGTVLVTGGGGDSAELYDPATGTWSFTGSLGTPGFGQSMVVLPDGRVLIAGGGHLDPTAPFLPPTIPHAGAELYDPATGSWTPTGSLNAARLDAVMTLLPTGKVLIVGGWNGSTALASAELYDPATGTWTPTGSMTTARSAFTATLLNNGRVLAAGGNIYGGGFALLFVTPVASAEEYDPATGNWNLIGSMNTPRQVHTATLLADGRVLVAGGGYGFLLATSSAELYDPASGSWAPIGSMNDVRSSATATLLPSGQVLATGGWDPALSQTAGVELYDPATGTWTSTDPMILGRTGASATLLPNGTVLVTGGNGPFGSAEIFGRIDLGCNPASLPGPDPAVSLVDGCGEKLPFAHEILDSSNGCERTRVVTYTGSDTCGYSITEQRVYTWRENSQPPILSCAPDKTVEQDPWWEFDEPTAVDACGSGEVSIAVLRTVSSGSCPELLTRTWEATDSCGNTATCSQTVTVVDTTPPVVGCRRPLEWSAGTTDDFVGPEAAAPSLDLQARLQLAGLSTLSGFDDCSENGYFAHSFTNLPSAITGATLKIRLRACYTTLTENDSLGLSFTTPTGGVQSESWSRYLGNQSFTSGLFPEIWGTGEVHEIELDLSQLPNADGSTTDLITALNTYGFLDLVVQDDTIIDYAVLTVMRCDTGDKTVACGTEWSFDEPSTYDPYNSDEVTLTVLSTETSGTCPTFYTRTWQGTDACGNTATYSQTVTVQGSASTPPVLTCAADKTVACDTDWSFDPPTARDACGGAATVSVLSTTSKGTCPEVITRLWIATDGCGNFATCSQTVTVTSPLQIIALPQNKTYSCTDDWKFDLPVVRGGCDGELLTPEIVGTVTVGSCPEIITRTWRVTDECGNTATYSQTLTITVPEPLFTVLPKNKTAACGSNWKWDEPVAAVFCDEIPALTVLSTVATGGCPQTITRTWQIADACGRTATCSQTVTLTDGAAPVIDCPEKEIWVPLNAECRLQIPSIRPPAFDDCTPERLLVYTQSPAAGTTSAETCEIATVTVTDACGNTSRCEVTVCAEDRTPPTLTCPKSVRVTDCLVPDVLKLVTATDGCAGANRIVLTQSPAAGTPIGPGGTSVTVTATDLFGNTAECVIPLTQPVGNSFLGSLFNTGVSGTGALLSAFSVDPHFTLDSVPAGMPTGPGGYQTPNAVVMTTIWTLLPLTGSRWIAPNADSAGTPAGDYTYATHFTLPTGADPATASITGRWAADNSAKMFLNGVAVSTTVSPPFSYEHWTPFTITGPFVAGSNTLTFVVNNVNNWIGLRVEFITASVDCEPCTPPFILLQTPDQTRPVSGTATFGVTVWGTPPLSIQWNRNGVPLSDGGHYAGVNTPNLTVTPVSYADAGIYTATISNACGEILSRPHRLTVTGRDIWWSEWSFGHLGRPLVASAGPDLVPVNLDERGISAGTSLDFGLPMAGGRVVNVLHVPPLAANSYLKVPMARSAGSEGLRSFTILMDVYLPTGTASSSSTLLSIFDRWGQVVCHLSPSAGGTGFSVDGMVEGSTVKLNSTAFLRAGQWNRLALVFDGDQGGGEDSPAAIFDRAAAGSLTSYLNGQPAGGTNTTGLISLGLDSIVAPFSSPEGTSGAVYACRLLFIPEALGPELISAFGGPETADPPALNAQHADPMEMSISAVPAPGEIRFSWKGPLLLQETLGLGDSPWTNSFLPFEQSETEDGEISNTAHAEPETEGPARFYRLIEIP